MRESYSTLRTVLAAAICVAVTAACATGPRNGRAALTFNAGGAWSDADTGPTTAELDGEATGVSLDLGTHLEDTPAEIGIRASYRSLDLDDTLAPGSTLEGEADQAAFAVVLRFVPDTDWTVLPYAEVGIGTQYADIELTASSPGGRAAAKANSWGAYYLLGAGAELVLSEAAAIRAGATYEFSEIDAFDSDTDVDALLASVGVVLRF